MIFTIIAFAGVVLGFRNHMGFGIALDIVHILVLLAFHYAKVAVTQDALQASKKKDGKNVRSR